MNGSDKRVSAIAPNSDREGMTAGAHVTETRESAAKTTNEALEKTANDCVDSEVGNSNVDGGEAESNDTMSFSGGENSDSEGIQEKVTDDEDDQLDPTDRVARAVTHKEKGNAHFQCGELSQASREYRRGATLLKNLNVHNEGDEQVKSLLVLLQTNLSMVCLKQEKYQMSRDVATKALSVDGGNVKALYRRAVASRKMGDATLAREDLRAALKVDPSNREVKRELLSIKKEIEAEKNKQRLAFGAAFSKKGGSGLYDDKEEELKRKALEKRKKKQAEKEALRKRKLRWEEENARRKAAGGSEGPEMTYEEWDKEEKKREKKANADADEARRRKEREAREEKEKEIRRRQQERAAKRKENRKQNGSDSAGDISGDDVGHDSSDEELLRSLKKENVRGYKKTSDGRTTSYFHRELSAHEKLLIGDIAPKKLDTGDCTRTDGALGDGGNEACAALSRAKESAWNRAQTWEERDTTGWCTDTLRSRLKESVAMSGSLVALINNVKDVSGEASFAVASGKRRYIFDYTASLHFEVFGGFRGGDGEHHQEQGDTVGSGSVRLSDISSTVDDGKYEVDVSWTKCPDNEQDANLAADLERELITSVRTSVEKFVADFNSHYS